MPYETKPMKKQWLEIEGRMTPIILPQIWNHELQDWVVTSEQNPLPTKVTGSNVELETASTEVTAGALVEVISLGALTDFTKFYINSHHNKSHINDYVVYFRRYTSEGNHIFEEDKDGNELAIPSKNRRTRTSDLIDIKAQRLSVLVENKSDIDLAFTISLLGVR